MIRVDLLESPSIVQREILGLPDKAEYGHNYKLQDGVEIMWETVSGANAFGIPEITRFR